MDRRTFGVATATGALGLLLGGCAGTPQAAGRTTLRLALNQSEDHPSFTALSNFSDRVLRGTGGRYDVDVFPNENLGAQQEALQLVSDGTVELAIVSGTQLESLNRDFVVFNLPHVFDSIEHQMRVITDESIVGDLFRSLEERNVTVLGGFTQGSRHVYTTGGPVRTPADLAGQKIRVQESALHVSMIELMGAAPTPMAYGEVYTALQSGVLDGAENNEVSYQTQKHYEAAGHFSTTQHLIGVDYLVVGTQALRTMAPPDRAVFERAWAATMTEFTRLWTSATNEAIRDVKSQGAQFHEVDTEAFRQAVEPLTESALSSRQSRRVYRATREAAV